MAILNILYLQFTFDSTKLKGLLSIIYNQRILTPYNTGKSLKIVILSTISNLTHVFIYLAVQLAVLRNKKSIFYHREHIKQNVLCSILQKNLGNGARLKILHKNYTL